MTCQPNWVSRNTRFTWAGGTFFLVVLLCQFFGFWWEIGLCVTYLRIQSTIELWHCVSFLVLVGNSFWCYIHTQCTIHLCGCVSFLLWQEIVLWRDIVLKMRTPFDFLRAVSTKKILLGYFIMIRQPMCVFCKTQHSFTLYLSILYLSLVPH